MGFILLYQNAQQKLFTDAKDKVECIKIVKEFYLKTGNTLEKVSEIYAIRIYFVNIIDLSKNKLVAEIVALSNQGIPQKVETATIWEFNGKYKDKEITIKTIDKKDITYHIWEVIEYFLKKPITDIIPDLVFTLKVKTKKNKEYNQKQKLILFFSKKENCGKLWKYSEVRKAMSKEGLDMVGRGIEGERPREFRYDLGYPFITSEQDKKVPDGSFIVLQPFPTFPRNERRLANINLEKSDWTELLDILKTDSKKLRCFECGLFEGESNKIGQKTKFELGHLQTHSSGGNVSKENIVAICKYCNSEQKNIFDIDPITGKKVYHIVPFLKTRNYSEKIIALRYLCGHLKKEDVLRIVKEIMLK